MRIHETKSSAGWALLAVAPIVALLAAGGLWIATLTRRANPSAPSASDLGVGIKKFRFHFTEADIAPIAAAMSNAGIDNFVLHMDPDTGVQTLVTTTEHKPHLDLLPGQCPNTFIVGGGDDAPMAAAPAHVSAGLLGNAFDVTQVDIPSVRLSPVLLQQIANDCTHEISPVETHFEDVGTPFDSESCQCTSAGPDGVLDLSMKFDREQMIEAFHLASQPDNTQFPLKVTGMTTDESDVFGTRDCILIVHHHDD